MLDISFGAQITEWVMPQHILVVDDEKEISRLIATRLKSNGFEVSTASSGEETLELIKERVFDLMIVDLMLPDQTGWQLAQRIRTDPNHTRVPIIILSGLIESEGGRENALDQGDYYLPKPFDREVLLEKVKQLLKEPSERSHG